MTEKIVPIAVIGEEAQALGLTSFDVRAFLLGFSLGREPSARLQDAEHLRFMARTILVEHTPNGNPVRP